MIVIFGEVTRQGERRPDPLPSTVRQAHAADMDNQPERCPRAGDSKEPCQSGILEYSWYESAPKPPCQTHATDDDKAWYERDMQTWWAGFNEAKHIAWASADAKLLRRIEELEAQQATAG